MDESQNNPEALEDVNDNNNNTSSYDNNSYQQQQQQQQFVNVNMENDPESGQQQTTTTAAAPYNAGGDGGKTNNGGANQSLLKDLGAGMDWGVQNFGIAFFSLLVLVPSSQTCDKINDVHKQAGEFFGNGPNPVPPCEKIQAFEVAASALSLIVSLGAGALHTAGKLDDKNIQVIISGFLFVWWVASVIVLTFFGDFQNTLSANGYFGSWGAFFFSIFALLHVSEKFEMGVDKLASTSRKGLALLIVSSAVEIGASISPCNPSSACVKFNAFAVALGTISIVIALGLLFAGSQLDQNQVKYISYFLVLWWVVGTGVVTFGGPFEATGNGYFASFAALLSSIYVVQST